LLKLDSSFSEPLKLDSSFSKLREVSAKVGRQSWPDNFAKQLSGRCDKVSHAVQSFSLFTRSCWGVMNRDWTRYQYGKTYRDLDRNMTENLIISILGQLTPFPLNSKVN
jgi:hypothetical protein